MQAIPNRVESGWLMGVAHWFGRSTNMPRYQIYGMILLGTMLGAAAMNGSATKEAVTSVQTQYQGKLEYHRENEKLIAKTAATALDACRHNLDAALNNEADSHHIKGCPPTPPLVKVITAPSATK